MQSVKYLTRSRPMEETMNKLVAGVGWAPWSLARVRVRQPVIRRVDGPLNRVTYRMLVTP